MDWKEEDENTGLKPEQQYPAEVIEAEERTSQKGNQYINLKLRVYDGEASYTAYDIIMAQMPDKLRAFCLAAGLNDKLKARTLQPIDCVGKNVRVSMSKEKNENGYLSIIDYDGSGAAASEYSERIAPTTIKTKTNQTVGSSQVNNSSDDVPFMWLVPWLIGLGVFGLENLI